MWQLLKGRLASWLIASQLKLMVEWCAKHGVDVDKLCPPVQGEVAFPLHTRLFSVLSSQLVAQAQQIDVLTRIGEGTAKGAQAANNQFEALYSEAYPLLSAEAHERWKKQCGLPAAPGVPE